MNDRAGKKRVPKQKNNTLRKNLPIKTPKKNNYSILLITVLGLISTIAIILVYHLTDSLHNQVFIWVLGVWAALITLLMFDLIRKERAKLKSEATLKESEERYRSLVDLSPDAIMVHMDGKLVYTNEKAVNLLGAETPEDLIGRPVIGFVHPESQALAKERIKQIHETGKSVDLLEEKFVRTDGQVVEVEVTAAPVSYLGQPAIQVIARKICERKRAEKALHESEVRYRTLFEQSPHAVIIIDPATASPIEFNDQAAAQLGYTREEFAQSKISDWEASENSEETEQHIRHIIQNGNDEFVTQHRTKDGKIIDVIVSIKTIEIENKVYFLVIMQDITDRQKALRSLSESEHRFRAIFESAKDSIFIKDQKLRYTHVNHAMEQLFECEASELIGKTDYDLFGKEAGELIRKADLRVLAGELVEEEHTLPIKGVLTTFNAIKVPMHNDDGKIIGICGIARDITLRKRAEEALHYRVEFERLLTTLSSEFLRLKLDEIDTGINNGLRTIGNFTKVDHSYIILFRKDYNEIEVTHEWCREGTSFVKDSFQNIDVDNFSLWMEKIKRLEYISVSSVEKLSPEETKIKEELKTIGIKSIILVPLIYDNSPVGLVGFDSVNTEIDWSDDTISLLTVVGEVFTNALMRKKAQEKLYELAAMPESNPHLVLTFNDKGEALYTNPTVLAVLKSLSSDDEKTVENILPKNYISIIEKCLRENKDIEDIRSCINDRNFRWDFHPIKDRPIVHCYGHDITEQLKRESELKKLSIAVTQSANMVVITDSEGIIEYVNPQFTRVTGYSVIEALGKTPRILKSGRNDISFYKKIWETIKSGRAWSGKIQNRRKNGEMFWERKMITPIFDDNGKIVNFLSVGDDITTELKTQMKLAESDKLSAIGTLAAGVAHEFKNYLGGIIGNASFALEELEDCDNIEMARETLAQIVDIGEKANDVAMSLLSYSKAKPDDFTKQDLRKIITRAIRLVEKEMKTLSIEIVTHYDDVPPVEISSSKVQQLLLNLLINAKHAIKTDGVITIALLKEDDRVMIKIGDTGGGIPKENLNKIFDPFFSTKGVWGKDELVGTGMGLSICRNIAHEHGGDLTVDSVVGMGTTFTLSLPLHDSSQITFDNNNNKELRLLLFTLDKSIITHYFTSSCEAKTKILWVDNLSTIKQNLSDIADMVICDAKFTGKVELYRMVELCRNSKFPYTLINCGTMEYQLSELYDNSVANYKELPDFNKLLQAYYTSQHNVVEA